MVAPRTAIWVASGCSLVSVSSMPSFGSALDKRHDRTMAMKADMRARRFGRALIGRFHSCN